MDECTDSGPKNEDVKNPPCLIGGFRGLMGTQSENPSITGPSYWHPFRLEDGSVSSVDMVRLKLSFAGEQGGIWLSDHAQAFQCDDLQQWSSRVRPGGWHELWRFGFGESAVALGLGWMDASCKVDMAKGFIEFNPNKVAQDSRFWQLMEKVQSINSRADLLRYDLAYDVPRSRKSCRLSKDRRMYSSVISGGITEYLGQRNAPGFVKVYDKAAELGIEGLDLTRIELTCSGEWSVEDVKEHWPIVHGWRSDGNTRDWVETLGLALAELAEDGHDVEQLVARLGKRSRPKIREWMNASCVELPEDAAASAIGEASGWRNVLASDSRKAV